MEAVKTNKYKNFITMILSLIMVGFTILFWFWYLYPYKIIEFNSITPIKENYVAGEPFSIEISYCKYGDLPAETTRQFINGIIFTLSNISASNAPIGCHSNVAMDIKIPTELSPDDYVFKQTMVYHPNPIRDVVVTFEVPVKVIK